MIDKFRKISSPDYKIMSFFLILFGSLLMIPGIYSIANQYEQLFKLTYSKGHFGIPVFYLFVGFIFMLFGLKLLLSKNKNALQKESAGRFDKIL